MASDAKGAAHWAVEAAEWAKLPCSSVAGRTNYAHLLEATCRQAREAAGDRLDFGRIPLSADGRLWPCLSRLMILDEPELVRSITPRFCTDLDRQAGTAMLQLMFRDVTGRRPKVRSWRHAKEELGL